ncbi:hypothetical protein F5Y07DRAFT_348031 [Xylaria sp. FL0933]|nr:hypothetical protein F5Y07DRAFT_348031 [Xylaria sp. FL0933]
MLNHNMSLGGEGNSVEDSTPVVQHSQKKYKCPQCPSSFKRPENLKRHERGHDESRRFVCQICDKSFARSDILARHVSIHTPLERRNDNPQRRRACRECAKARERCSRGEPCRRCTIKALCCLYPEEHPFKTMAPHTWSPLTAPGSSHSNATGSEWFDSQPLLGDLYIGEETLLQGLGPPRLQDEVSPVLYGEPSTSSAPTYKGAYPCQSDYLETRFASPFGHEGLSFRGEGSPCWPSSTISTADEQLVTGGSELVSIPGGYDQALDMALDLVPTSTGIGSHQTGSAADLHQHYRRPSHDTKYFSTTYHPHTTPGELESLDLWMEHQYVDDTQTPNIDLDDQEIYFQSG